MMGKLTLPCPPSTNSLYRNAPGKGRVKTVRYQVWLAAARVHANDQPRWKVEGEYTLDLTVERRRKNADLDNTIKAVSDFLVAEGYVSDDKHMTEIKVRWGDVKGCDVQVKAVGEG